MISCPPAPTEAVAEPAGPPRIRQSLWQRYHGGGCAEVENELVQQYLPLVRHVAARIAMTLPSHVDFDDLHSAGLAGLLQAIRNYDPDNACSFETYARLRIRGAVLDELRRLDWVPRSVRERARKIQEVMADLGQKLRAVPTEEQMAAALGLSLAAYQTCLEEIRPATFVCLDAAGSFEDGDAPPLSEVLGDPTSDDPAEHAARLDLARLIAQRIEQLPEVQRKVLALYYFEGLHLREIALAFGLTESRISQIHAQAILSIRAFLDRCERGTPNLVTPQP